jgi:hypothetical protein
MSVIAVPDPYPIDDDDDMIMINGVDDTVPVSSRDPPRGSRPSTSRKKSKREVCLQVQLGIW